MPRRWVVERTFGWFNWCCRLSKDYEVLPATSETKSVIVDFLEVLAFDERSNYQDYAMQVLEEYWIS